MAYEITLDNGDIDLGGWGNQRSIEATRQHIPELVNRAVAESHGTHGLDLTNYTISIIRHDRGCPGQCPDELGLNPECDIVQQINVAHEVGVE